MTQPTVDLYWTSATGMLKVKKEQQQLRDLLTAKGIKFNEFDVAADQEAKEKMRGISGKATLPQLMINNKYAGDAEDLFYLEEDNKFVELFK